MGRAARNSNSARSCRLSTCLLPGIPGGPTPSQSGWVNSRYEFLVDQSLVAFADATRTHLSQQATAAMNDDVVHLYMVQFYNLFATRAGVQGVVPRLDENVTFDAVTKP